jgi:hypothetical protein
MAFDAHKNLAYSTVATAPSPALSGVTVVLQSGDGARFPAAPFNVLIWAAGALPLTSNAEIARCTTIVSDTLTIARATATEPNVIGPRAIVVGDQIAVAVTAKALTDIEALIGVNANAKLGADVTIVTAGTWYDGPSVSLATGTWFVTANGYVLNNVGASDDSSQARISDGSTHYASCSAWADNAATVGGEGRPFSFSMTTIMVLAAPATIKLQVTSTISASNNILKAALVNNGVGNNATQISAIRLA